MKSCFGCGEPTWEFETVNLKKKLSSSEEAHLFHTTETTNYETTSLDVPFCRECKKRATIYHSLVFLGLLLIIGTIYYIWHIYLPNFFEINGFFMPLGVLIAYIAIVGALGFICHKIVSSITGHRKNPNDHPEIVEMISDGWKKGNVY